MPLKLSRAALAAAFAVPVLASAQQAPDEEAFFAFADWRVWAFYESSEQDDWVRCEAVTGGDGDPTIVVYTTTRDVRPPDMFPWVWLEESAPRGYDTLMQDGDVVAFAFADGPVFEALVSAAYDADGIRVARAEIDELDNQAALRALRDGDRLRIIRDGAVVYDASLAGFTASYGKMAEHCDFPVGGVID
jgi:hypothetical protein